MMAKEASWCLLFLSFLIMSCSGALVGFSYRESGDTATSLSSRTISFLQQSKVSPSQIRVVVTDHRILSTLTNSNVSVDFCLNNSLVENVITSKPSGISWLKAHLVNFLSQVDIKSIIFSCGSECLSQNEVPLLVPALKSVYSVLNKLHLGREVKVSVAFPLSFLEKMNVSHEKELRRILSFIKKTKSFVVIEDSLDGELRMGDHFVQSIVKRATVVDSLLPCKDVPVVLTFKSSVIPSSKEAAQFSEKVSKYLDATTQITKRVVALYAEVHSTTEDFARKELTREEEELFPVSHREILSKIHTRRTLDDTTNPPNTVYPTPTNPTSGTPVITPPDTPTIITVPPNNPVTISPMNPAAMPVTVPSTTPVPSPPSNPANSSAVPVTNPAATPATVPGATPVTNPVSSYPPPSGATPVTNPVSSYPPPSPSGATPVTNPVASYPPPSGNVSVTNPQPPPGNTNAPAIQGQSWCVAKAGASQTALQAALDYACGMGGADCSQIQQGGSCYNPVSLQNHASYAFNSYYQKHPAPTSCDFGGSATLVNTNPSSGSCVFPSSSSSSSTTTPTSSPPTTPSPSTTTPPPSPLTPAPSIPTTPPTTSTPHTPSSPTAPPTTPSSSGGGTSGNGTPPSVLNSSNPASGTMPGFPSTENTTTLSSHSDGLRPSIGCMVLMISFITARLSMHP